jgi:hypothetical protein
MRTLLVVGLAVGALGIGACSSSSTPELPNHDSSVFCTNLAKAQCNVANTCATDPSACETTLEATCNSNAATYEGEGRTYQQPAAQACIDAWTNATSNNNLEIKYADLVGNGEILDKCERVFTGSVGNLGACTSQYECSGSLGCYVAGTSTEMFCATETTVAAGGQCGESGQVCAASTYCSGNPAVCVAAVGDGQECSPTDPCVSTDHCVNGSCQPRAAAGGACLSNADCGSAAPYCDPLHQPGPACTIGLEFAPGSYDCQGFVAGDSLVEDGTSTTTGTDGGTDGAAAGD